MDIIIKKKTDTPEQDTWTPFGTKVTIPASSSIVTETLTIDDTAKANLASILINPSPVHLTSAELAIQYSATELLNALVIVNTPKS